MLLICVHFILILPKSKTNEFQSHASKFWFKEIIWSYFVCFSGKIKENSRRAKETISCHHLLPLFLPKWDLMLPITPKRDPFFSSKYSCSQKPDICFNTSRPSERLSLAWRFMSRSSETQVAWARPSWSINNPWIRKWILRFLERNYRTAGVATTSRA